VSDTENVGKNGGIKIPASILSVAAGIAVVLAAAWTLSGMNGKVNELSAELARVQLEVETLRDLSRDIEDMQDRIADNRESIRELENVRDDIATAICEVLERSPSECGVT
jgi:hypothetical protein